MAIVAHGYGRPAAGAIVTGGYGLATPAVSPGDGIDLEVVDTGHVAIIRDHGHLAALFDHTHIATVADTGHLAAFDTSGATTEIHDTGHTTAEHPWLS